MGRSSRSIAREPHNEVPTGIDDDGMLFCNQEFADYPVRFPAGAADPWSLTGRSMLLSSAQPVTASSSTVGHEPGRAAERHPR